MDSSQAATRRTLRRLRWAAVGLVLPVLVAAAVALWLRPGAPRRVQLLTGPAGSAEADWGARYAAAVRERGLEVELIATSGPAECLRRVGKAKGDAVAVVPGGAEALLGPAPGEHALATLGTVLIEPLWKFVAASAESPGGDTPPLARLRVASGPAESASGLFATQFFRDNGLDPSTIKRLSSDQARDAMAALERAEIDAAIVAGLPNSAVVGPLLAAPGVLPLSFERAAAYRVRHPWLLTITVPQGAFDLGANRPAEDLHLLAVGVGLAVPKRIHVAAIRVLLDAARETVRGGTEQPERMISERLDLPTLEYATLPIHPAARAYYDRRDDQDLKTLVFRLLPYRVARWLDRWGIVLLALAASALVFVKVLPALVRLYFTRHLSRAYRAMGEVEKAAAAPHAHRAALLARLDELDRASLGLPVPRRLGAEYMDFRQFLHDLRERVEGLAEPGA